MPFDIRFIDNPTKRIQEVAIRLDPFVIDENVFLHLLLYQNLWLIVTYCWLLGYSDQITSNYFSQGLISDYNFIQITPNKNASFLTDDVDILKN